MSNRTIRVGIVGAGRNTREKHIPRLREQPGVEIVAVVNRTRESSERVAREFAIPKVAADWPSLLDDPEIDAVCIGTWPYLHAPVTIAALEKGKHVLCEARMAMNAGEAHAMLAASRRNPHLVAQIVPAPATLAFDKTIVEIISSGRIGEIVTVDARVAIRSGYPDPAQRFHWRHDRSLSGNNIMSMGIWYECMMRWVGPARSVFALGRTVVPHRPDENGRQLAVTVPDHVDILCELYGGGQLRFCMSNMLGDAPSIADILIFGTEGVLRFVRTEEGDTLYMASKGGAGLEPVEVDPAKKAKWRVEEEFVSAIRGIEPITHTDFLTGTKYMEWTDAVTLSMQRHEMISLPLNVSR